jgi:hypothetical protein
VLSLCRHCAFTVPLLCCHCRHCAFTVPSLCCHCRHCAVTVLSLCRHCAVTVTSLCFYCAVTVPSLCSHCAITVSSPCCHCAVTVPLPCCHYAVTVLSLRTVKFAIRFPAPMARQVLQFACRLSPQRASLAKWQQHLCRVVTDTKGSCVLFDSHFAVLNSVWNCCGF